MLGLNHQAIYCKVTGCKHNQTNHTRNMQNKIIATRHICEKEKINIDKNGKCVFAKTKVLP